MHFSGLEWNVKTGVGGPGPNNWSDDPGSVWTDSSGYLHMKIRKIEDTWHCSEVYLLKSYGHGEYRFDIISDVEQYDPNIVVGLFTYETDEREIDIEFARWGDPGNLTGWYTVQPSPYTTINQSGFSLGLNGSSSSHIFNWQAESIKFQSFKPFTITVPQMDSLIHQWAYTGNRNPPVGNERLHINFWLFQGSAPINQEEAELVIRSVQVPDSSTGLISEHANRAVHLFPNPASYYIRVELPGMGNKIISVFNCIGILVLRMEINDSFVELDLNKWENGIYLLNIENTSGTLMSRMIVQH